MPLKTGQVGRALGTVPLHCNICREPLRPSLGISVLQVHSDRPEIPPTITICGVCDAKHFDALPEA